MKLRNQIMPLNANTPCDNTIRCLKVMTYKTDNVAKTRLSGRLLLLLLLSRTSDSVLPHRRQPARLPRPWDSPGKNTGVGCHFLLQCMKVKVKHSVVFDS